MAENLPGREAVEAVAKMQRYMLEHIHEPITQQKLAQAAGYSPFYSAKLFRMLTGLPPFLYLRRLRLSRSALKLRDEPARVIDVALEYVFDSHEGFTRAFAREFGVTPKHYSENPGPIPLFLPADVTSYYLYQLRCREEPEMKQTQDMIFVQIMERPARKLILKRGKKAEDYFAYCEEVGCDVWGILVSIKEALYEPIGLWLPSSMRSADTSVYAQGVEVPADYQGEIPEGFDCMDLPACKMMVFQGPPYEDSEFMDAVGRVWRSLESFDPKLYGYEYAPEDAPRFQLSPEGYRGYIEGRPVRPVKRV